MNKKDTFKITYTSLGILTSVFYWYEWRPIQIRKECEVKWDAVSVQDYQNKMYEMCLHENGL